MHSPRVGLIEQRSDAVAISFTGGCVASAHTHGGRDGDSGGGDCDGGGGDGGGGDGGGGLGDGGGGGRLESAAEHGGIGGCGGCRQSMVRMATVDGRWSARRDASKGWSAVKFGTTAARILSAISGFFSALLAMREAASLRRSLSAAGDMAADAARTRSAGLRPTAAQACQWSAWRCAARPLHCTELRQQGEAPELGRWAVQLRALVGGCAVVRVPDWGRVGAAPGCEACPLALC